MLKQKEILGVAALSAFIGAVVGLFLFGSFGGEITPGPQASASPHGVFQAASLPISQMDPGTPLTTTTFTNVADHVIPAIVVITSQKTVRTTSSLPLGNDPFRRFFFGNPLNEEPQDQEVRGLGSGVIVSPDGYILTNNHVVNDADKVQVRLDKHSTLEAKVIGTDPQSDLAVLKVDAKDLSYLKFGDSDAVRIGEWVAAVGAPFGLDRSLTVGIVSAKGRSNVGVTGQGGYEDFIQTDAAINHGNSGGALVNLNGDLIGINTAIATNTGGSNGVGFSIPINMARSIMTSLIEDGRVSRGWLGIYIRDVDEQLAKGIGLKEVRGVVVSGVQKDTPADKAGLKSYDVILKLDDTVIDDVSDLRNRVAATKPGTKVNLGILRDGKTINVVVKLDELPTDLAEAGGEDPSTTQDPSVSKGDEEKLGIEARTMTPDLAREMRTDETRGILITAVARGSRAERGGLQKDDVILEVNRSTVGSVDDLRKAIQNMSKGDTVVLRVARNSNYLFLVIEM